jgi:GNAT superfamily N-acetyltransferase
MNAVLSSLALPVTPFQSQDFDGIVAVDAAVTGREKREFWREFLVRNAANPNMYCRVVHLDGVLTGYLVGEIRAWEFGQEPAGWVLSLGVLPGSTRKGLGSHLLEDFQRWLLANGIGRIRTMVAHEQALLHRFFRTSGFVSGPVIELEKEVHP